MEITNNTDFFVAVATTTGQMFTDLVPFLQMFTGALFALFCAGGIMYAIVLLVKKWPIKGRY